VFEDFVNNAGLYIQTNPWLAVVAVFVGGILTASNPCVLAMIPLMMSFVAGRREKDAGILRAFLYSLVFVLGLSLTFTLLGVIAALAGSLYGEVSGVWNWIVAAVCLVMGLHLMGVLKFSIPMPFNIQPKIRGGLGAFILGLLFGVVSAPCAAPILVVLLTYLAGSGASVTYGGFLLLIYALGHSVLILIAGTSMGFAKKLIESKRAATTMEWLRRGAGLLIVLVGIFFAYQGIAKNAAEPEKKTVLETNSPAKPAKPKVSRIVFIGQKEACECTRNRIEASWEALQAANSSSPKLPVERIDRDAQAKAAEKYTEMKALMVVPGIYCLDAKGALIEMLQGEVTKDKIAKLLE